MAVVLRNIQRLMTPSLWCLWWKTWRTFPVWSWIHAASEYKAGNYRTAASMYKRGLSKTSKHIAGECARLDYAYCLYRLGELLEAEAVLEQMINSGSKLRDAHLLFAEILIRFGRIQQAARVLSKAREQFPDDIRIITCNTFALVASKVDRDDLVSVKRKLEDLRQKLSLEDKGRSRVLTALAYYEMYYGDAEVGNQMLARVLAEGGYPVEALIIRGEWYFENGSLAQAIRLFQRALEVSPRHPKPYGLLAEALLLRDSGGDIRKAETLAETACKLSNWRNASHLKVLASSQKENGNEDSALLVTSLMKRLVVEEQINLESLGQVEVQVAKLRELQFTPR